MHGKLLGGSNKEAAGPGLATGVRSGGFQCVAQAGAAVCVADTGAVVRLYRVPQ